MLATIFYNVAAAGIAAKDKPLALFELFGWLKYFRQQRLQKNLSQQELLKKELLLIAYAILGIFVLILPSPGSLVDSMLFLHGSNSKKVSMHWRTARVLK